MRKSKGKNAYYSPEEVIIKLKKLIKIIERVQSGCTSEITHAQARVIFPIIRDGRGYTMQELADIVGVTKGLVSRTITDLESKGYVERDKISKNQDRNYNIILSTRGQELVTQKMMQMKKVSNQWGGKITHNDMLNFKKVLDILTESPN